MMSGIISSLRLKRVVNRWNRLGKEVVSVATVDSFKKRLSKEREQKIDLLMNH